MVILLLFIVCSDPDLYKSYCVGHHIYKPDVVSFADGKAKYLLWFDQITAAELISLKEISKKTILVKKYDFKDGYILSCLGMFHYSGCNH